MINATDKTSELIRDDDFIVYVESALAGSKVKRNSIEELSGNINRVKRLSISLTTGDTSLIVKQVPEAGRLAGYPTLFFSSDRLAFDHHWLTTAAAVLKEENGQDLKVPRILHYDSDKRIMIMEDLGRMSLSEALPKLREAKEVLVDLLEKAGRKLASIHTQAREAQEKRAVYNKAASDNRPYLFSYHIKEPDMVSSIWKDNGAQGISLDQKRQLQKAFLEAHRHRLEPILDRLSNSFSEEDSDKPDIKVYCHGDLHTGSIMLFEQTQKSCLAIIDAEFCDLGPPGFDPGVLTAHLIAELLVLGYSQTDTRAILASFPSAYMKCLEAYTEPKEELVLTLIRHTGAELLRRLLGPAGFNVTVSKEQFEELLEKSIFLLTRPELYAGEYLHG
ncbi:MAG: phosphotransferase [Cyanobacteriota/Melainabacteria group bacterium]